jgi:NADH dehydrogenase
MQQMLGVIHRRRLILNIPFWIATIMGAVMEFVQAITFRLIPPQITRDQVQSLKSDNVVSEGAKTFADLGIEPTSLEAVLPDYLWRFRPDGQYDDIKRSASNLRGA